VNQLSVSDLRAATRAPCGAIRANMRTASQLTTQTPARITNRLDASSGQWTSCPRRPRRCRRWSASRRRQTSEVLGHDGQGRCRRAKQSSPRARPRRPARRLQSQTALCASAINEGDLEPSADRLIGADYRSPHRGPASWASRLGFRIQARPLEGLEVAFIVIALGAQGGLAPGGGAGAAAALVVTLFSARSCIAP